MLLYSAPQGMWIANLSLLQINQEKSSSKTGREGHPKNHIDMTLMLHLPEKSYSTPVSHTSKVPRRLLENAADCRELQRTWIKAVFGDKCLVAVK